MRSPETNQREWSLRGRCAALHSASRAWSVSWRSPLRLPNWQLQAAWVRRRLRSQTLKVCLSLSILILNDTNTMHVTDKIHKWTWHENRLFSESSLGMMTSITILLTSSAPRRNTVEHQGCISITFLKRRRGVSKNSEKQKKIQDGKKNNLEKPPSQPWGSYAEEIVNLKIFNNNTFKFTTDTSISPSIIAFYYRTFDIP